MPEEETTTAAVEETTTDDGFTDDERTAVEKADNPDAVRNAIQRQKDAVKEARQRADAAEARAKTLEDEKLSEQERKDKAATEAADRAAKAEAKALRYEVAAEKGVPLTQAHRLQGSTKEELETDADAFLKDVKGGNGTTTFDGGPRETAERPKDFDSQIRARR